MPSEQGWPAQFPYDDIVYIPEHNGGRISILTLDGERLARWSEVRSIARATAPGSIHITISMSDSRVNGAAGAASSNVCGNNLANGIIRRKRQ
jgi:hypothetical protein